MGGEKFLQVDTTTGNIKETVATQTGGSGKEDLIPSLDSTGRIDSTMLPVGVGPDAATILASENLSAGDFVNLWDDAGTVKARKADATTASKEATGYVLAAVTSGQNATVFFESINTQLTGLTGGAVYFLSTTAGEITTTVPSASGNVVQRIGRAISTTAISFEGTQAVTLA